MLIYSLGFTASKTAAPPLVESLSQQIAIRQQVFGESWLGAKPCAIYTGMKRVGSCLEKCISQKGRRAALTSSLPAPPHPGSICTLYSGRREGESPLRSRAASTGRGEHPGA